MYTTKFLNRSILLKGTPNQPASLLIDTTFYATFVAGVMVSYFNLSRIDFPCANKKHYVVSFRIL